MLVLSRKVDEEIQIGDDIRVIVTKIAGNRVSIGIQAPGSVPVVRGELNAPNRPVRSNVVPANSQRSTVSIAEFLATATPGTTSHRALPR